MWKLKRQGSFQERHQMEEYLKIFWIYLSRRTKVMLGSNKLMLKLNKIIELFCLKGWITKWIQENKWLSSWADLKTFYADVSEQARSILSNQQHVLKSIYGLIDFKISWLSLGLFCQQQQEDKHFRYWQDCTVDGWNNVQ